MLSRVYPPTNGPKVREAPELTTDKLVIGYNLAALQYAINNNGMLLVNGATVPHSIDEKDKSKRWYQLTFDLGIRGLLPIPSDVETVRIEDNTAYVTTEFYKMIKIHFTELYVFDLELVRGLEVEEKVYDYVVYDWFNIRRGAKQASCKIYTPNNFVKELVFYPSLRKDGNDGSFKDCYTKSYIAASALQEFEYSETAARFAALKLIKDNGLRGPKRSLGDTEHYLNLLLEHDKRELHKNKKDFIVESEAPNIFYCNISKEWT